MFIILFCIIVCIIIAYLVKERKIGFAKAFLLPILNSLLGLLTNLRSKDKSVLPDEAMQALETLSMEDGVINDPVKSSHGTCDFCGREGKLFAAPIISQEAMKVKSQVRLDWHKGQIATLYRCFSCRFWHVVKPISPVLVLIMVVWVLITEGLILAVPIAMIIFVFSYKFILDFLNTIVVQKKIENVLFEQKIISNLPIDTEPTGQIFAIQNDDFKFGIVLIGAFFGPVILLCIVSEIRENQLEKSYGIHRRLGVGFAAQGLGEIVYDNKGRSYYFYTQMIIKNRNEADTMYPYKSWIHGQSGDTCSYWCGVPFPKEDSLFQHFLNQATYIPIVYDATNKGYGQMLLTSNDFQQFGYTKASVQERLGLDSLAWHGYDSLYHLIEIYQTKGRCSLFETLHAQASGNHASGMR
jgi:hypothetical protein